ncbi:MAG: M48 family metalloprotease [Alphaproteobacteria bacterium]|nr:M48 family metalloprotease [Alphaproteobacteria bacterium]
MKRLPITVFLLLAVSLVFPQRGIAQSAPVIIRDTEIETTLKDWMAPLLKAANMSPGSVEFVIVQSPQINAFVAGGSNIFLYTGLIAKAENPSEIIGVMAHELGHIAGGHLIGTRGAFERASYESILGTVLGIGAAIATGNGAAANAIMSGTNAVAERRFLAHSRIYESSADQAALRFLTVSEIDPSGLQSFLSKLESEELLPTDRQSEYVRTHPLTRDRIDGLSTRIAASKDKGQPLPLAWIAQHDRMKAKLAAYIDPGRVAWIYGDRDQEVPARYARAIAAYRQKNIAEALKGIDALIAQESENPYFQELKAQILRDSGRVAESLPFYKKAVTMLPRAGLIRIDYAHALLESGPNNQAEAITNLERALQDEPRSPRIHRLLATAYGQKGDEGMAKLHLAEEAVLQRRLDYAKAQAQSALKILPAGNRARIQAQDLLAQIEVLEKDAH